MSDKQEDANMIFDLAIFFFMLLLMAIMIAVASNGIPTSGNDLQ